MRTSSLRSVLGPTQGFGAIRESLRPRIALQKLRYRADWLRFARRIEIHRRPGLVRLGSAYGGYVVPLALVDADWICYSGGLGDDISFELELIAATECRMYGFDPTPRAVAHAQGVAAHNPHFTFMPVGLWSSDTSARFYKPADSRHASHSIAGLQGTDGFITAACRSLPSLMAELGHDRIDLLKLDVEGAEYEVLEPLLRGDLKVRVLCVDFHKVESISHMTRTVEQLDARGYRPVHVHRTDVTMIRP
jgi:FkbM family methyltransferase